MEWNIEFIDKNSFKNHVKKTIETYGSTLKSIDLKKFNSNIVDPIKFTFDSKVYNKSIEQIIIDEIARQRDKSNTNAIGYFHQNMFRYLENCEVPEHVWDVVFHRNDGITFYVEMKNKHNTMNSSSSQKTYMKMQNQIINKNDCICCLVEVIAKKSQNIVWSVSLDGQNVSAERIRRISIDKFYEMVTGIPNAFKQICDVLPSVIEEIISEYDNLQIEEDTVISELRRINPDLLKALYLLAFKTYEGF